MEVRNIFKGLDLIDRVPDELWTEVRDIVQETGIKTIPWKRKEMQKSKRSGLQYIKSKLKCSEHQDVDQNGRQGLFPSEVSNVPSSFVRLTMGMKQCMY